MSNVIDVIDYLKNEINQKEYTKSKILITFIGGPGSGKSTIAKIIGDKLNLYIHSGDYIRRLLDRYNLTNNDFNENQKLVNEISVNVQSYLCESEIGYLLDANILPSIDLINERIKKTSYKLIVLKIDCDGEVMQKRIKKRLLEKDPNNFSGAIIENYNRYINTVENINIPDGLVFETIDTTNEISENQIIDIVNKIETLYIK